MAFFISVTIGTILRQMYQRRNDLDNVFTLFKKQYRNYNITYS